MQINTITSPVDECISLDLAKEYLRVDHDAEDRVITDLIPAAREIIQNQLGYYVGKQRVQVSVPLVKREGRKLARKTVGYMRGRTCIRLPLSPILSVDGVKVISMEGKEETVSDKKYHSNLKVYPALVILDYEDKDMALIDLTVGTKEPSQAIKTKILATLADLYENRMPPMVDRMPLSSGICP